MRPRNVPPTGPRYWTALCIASVFGANLGDFVSHDLHLGHDRGLAPLALIFILAIYAETRFAKTRPSSGNEAFYWIAIVTLRTAATNLGDLATHDFKLPALWVVIALAVVLALLLSAAGRRAGARTSADTARASGVPNTDGLYWAAMLTAGTLGTVGGDAVSGDLGLGVGPASLVLCGIVGAALAWRSLPAMAGVAGYWLVVVAIRTAGTTVGDYLAFRHGIALGLKLSTAATGIALVLVLLVWRRSRHRGVEGSSQSALAGS
jgi:uncharacterized membrane-anchored protein